MTTATKQRPRVGDTAWEVEWIASIPSDENGDSLMDQADTRSEFYPTKERAEARAREVAPLSAIGCAMVTPAVFTAYDDDDAARYPHAGYWEFTDDGKEWFA